MNKLFRFLIFAALIPPVLFACSKQGIDWQSFEQSSVSLMLQPGEKIDDMVITTGTEDAAPLWVFCLPTVESEHLITVDCQDLSYPRLAIGHTFGVMDLVPESVDWSELSWEMDIDGHPVDLNAFGIHEFIHPDLMPSPSPVREVFRALTVWDIVLNNPAPGKHTLRGQARSGAETYGWVLNFTIASSPDS